MKAPCKNCEKRYIGCHGRCEKYLKYKQWNEGRLHEHHLSLDADQYQVNNTMRIRRSWQRRLRK